MSEKTGLTPNIHGMGPDTDGGPNPFYREPEPSDEQVTARIELLSYLIKHGLIFPGMDERNKEPHALIDAVESAARAEGRAEAQQEIDALKAEMARLTEVWLASPEAAKRFEGYRELGAKCAELEGEVTRLSSLLAQLEQGS